MSIDVRTIERTAELSSLYVSDDEKAKYAEQLSQIISYVEKINKLDTSDVSPTDHIAELKNVFRADTVIPSIEPEAIRAIAPEFARGHFVVPKIIDGEA